MIRHFSLVTASRGSDMSCIITNVSFATLTTRCNCRIRQKYRTVVKAISQSHHRKSWQSCCWANALFLLFVLSALRHMRPCTTLVKKLSHTAVDWSCHTKNICVHTHTLQNAHHHFHVNLYHGIKHDCGKTCVYNSMYIIYIYNFKYTIYLIFFSYETSMQKHEYGKNNYFFFMMGRRKCKKHEQQKKVFLGMSCSKWRNVF